MAHTETLSTGTPVLVGTAGVFRHCHRCGGTGRTSFLWVDGGVCYRCGGTGCLTQDRIGGTLEEAEKRDAARLRRNAKAAEKRAAQRAAEDAEREAERAARNAEKIAAAWDEAHALNAAWTGPTPDAPEGRVVVEGEIRSMKYRENAYGGAWKMLVRSDEGWKVWGSVPREIMESEPVQTRYYEDRYAYGSLGAAAAEVLIGARVRFTATLSRSDEDRLFAFAKRPTKAEVL